MSDYARYAAMFLLSGAISLVLVVAYAMLMDFWDRRR
jgi:hypothetical protein